MNKKFWVWAIGIIPVVILLPACAAIKSQATVATTQPTSIPHTITIWHQWSGDTLTTIQKIFYQYMAEHPNVTIVLDSPQDIKTALQQAVPNGIGPDIISWANDTIGSYAKSGYIIDLGTLGINQDFLTTNYEPAAVDGVIWQRKVWALPESQDAIAIVYNKALVSEADFPADPMDFAGLLTKAKNYASSNPDKYLLCNQGLGSAAAYDEAPIYFGFGVPGYVDETGKVYLNTPQALQAGSWIKEFSTYAPKEASSDTCLAGIENGTFASWWTGIGSITNFEKAGIDYGIVPMGKPLVGINTLMICSNANMRGNAATALDIIQYLTNQASETQLAVANKVVPANSSSLRDPQVQGIALVKGFGAAAKLGIAMPNTPYADAQWGPVGEATLAIWNGTQTPEQALSTAQTAIETAIASMK